MATFAQLTEHSGSVPMFVRARLLGIPHKFSGINAGGADGDGSTAYSVNPVTLCTAVPANWTNAAGYYGTISGISTTGESADLTSGKSTLGSITIEVKDWKQSDGSWYLANLFAPGLSTRQTTLSANLTRTATSISADDNLTPGTAYFIGTECVVATAATTITRGAAGSIARAHDAATATTASEDGLWSRPRTFRNIEIVVDVGFDSSDVDGETGGERRFIMTRPPRMKADGTWVIKADSYWRILDKKVGRGAYQGELQIAFTEGVQSIVLGSVGTQRDAQPAFASGSIYVTDGDEVLAGTLADVDDGLLQLSDLQRALYGSKRSLELVDLQGPEQTTTLREVLVTDDQASSTRFGYTPNGGSFTASAHPLRVFLNLILSRDGDGTNLEGTDNSYDVLPPPWGIAIPADRVDVDEFEAKIAATPDAVMRMGVIGMDGPISPREFFEKEIAPVLGLALAMKGGRISLAPTTDTFPLEEGASAGLAAIDAAYHDYDMQQLFEAGLLTFKYTKRNGAEERVEVLDVVTSDLFPDESREQAFELTTYAEDMRGVLIDRATYLGTRQSRPRSVVTLRLPIRYAMGDNEVTVGSRIRITDAGMPDALSGGYGVTNTDWRVYAQSIEISPGGSSASVAVKAQRSSFKAGHLGPCGKVSAWDAGNKRATIEANEFSDANQPTHPYLVDKDIKAFGDDGSQGGAGLLVDFWDSDGVRQTADRNEITSLSYSGSTMDLTTSPSSTPQVGWYVRLTSYKSAIVTDAAAGTIDERQDDAVYQADKATLLLDSSDNAYEWGA